MTDREKLVELLEDIGATCDVPSKVDADGCGTYAIEGADYLADHLLANGVIVLPCKVGAAVYEVRNNTDACDDCRHYFCGFGDCWCGKISDIDLRQYPQIAESPLCEKQFMEIGEFAPNIDWIFSNRKCFGKTVFLTREEAEAALKEGQ